MRKAMLRVALSVALFALTLQALGQSYPTRPIRMIIPYPPGGGSTNIGRLLAQELSENIGQQLVVDNRGGANGTIGMELAAQAPSDGYTIVFALTAQLAINPSYYPELRYDPVRDYAPISLLGTAPYVLVAHPSVPAKSVKEMLALAKSQSGKLTHASSGTGGIPHLAFEMLKMMGGIDIPHVPYKGGGAALPDLLGGRVQFLISTVSPVLPHLRSGKLRPLGATSPKRVPSLPEVPSIGETIPGYAVLTWYAVMAPAGTPKNVVAKLNAEFVKAVNAPAVKEKLRTYDFEVIGSTPEELGKYIRSEIATWAKAVKASGAKAN